jgi:RNA polymerase sigma-70 factor, ECF subfamily
VRPDERPVDLGEVRDRDLIERIRGGEQDAFRALFRRYAPTAMAIATRLLRAPVLAEEAVQEAFLAVWKNPAGFDPERGSVRGWLLSAVHHRAVDLLRREEAQRHRFKDMAAEPMVDVPDPAAEVVEDIGLAQERAAVRAALDALPIEQRRVVDLMYFGGLSQRQIADQLELPLGTVKSRTLLAMRRLRLALLGIER